MINETTRLQLRLSNTTNTISKIRNEASANELYSTALAINSLQSDLNLQEIRRIHRYEIAL